jgi:hypothetical protein
MEHEKIPAATTLRRFLLEMHLVSDVHIGCVISESYSTMFGFDGSQRYKQEYIGTLWRNGEKTFTGGISQAAGGNAQNTVDCLLRREGEIKALTELIFGKDVADKFGYHRCTDGAGGSGLMNDHCNKEDKAGDILEEVLHNRFLENDEYRRLSKEEQEQTRCLIRQKCYQHKIANLSQACVKGAKVYRQDVAGVEEGGGRRGQEQPVSADTFVYSMHKLIAQSVSASDLCLCKEFL